MDTPATGRRRWPRRLALTGVAVVLLALAAATFTLSYDGIHVIALGAGVPARLARYYPGLLDAALVIACLASVMLRDGRWWARWYAWLAIILIVAAGAGANALHSMNVVLPRRQTAGAVAVAPWILLLLSFSLWLTAARGRRGAPAADATPGPEIPAAEAPVQEDVPVSGQVWPRDYWDADEDEDGQPDPVLTVPAESPAESAAESPTEVHHLNRPRSLPAPPEEPEPADE